jgi:hypothetical protein
MVALLFISICSIAIFYWIIADLSGGSNTHGNRSPSSLSVSKQMKLAIDSLRAIVLIHLFLITVAGYFAFIGFLDPKYYDLGITFLGITLFFLAEVALNLWLIRGIKGLHYWAWLIAIVNCILFLPTGFFSIPCGVALFSLLHPTMRSAIQSAKHRQ